MVRAVAWCARMLTAARALGLLGHTMVNNLLEHLSPLIVSVVLLMEPLVGSLIGFAFGKQDMPGLFTWVRAVFSTALGTRVCPHADTC